MVDYWKKKKRYFLTCRLYVFQSKNEPTTTSFIRLILEDINITKIGVINDNFSSLINTYLDLVSK